MGPLHRARTRGRAFNVGTGEPTTVASLARTVQQVTDTDSAVVDVVGRAGDIDESVADLRAARGHLDYEPCVASGRAWPTSYAEAVGVGSS